MNGVGKTPTESKGYSPLDCLAGVSRKFPELFAQLDGLLAAVHAHDNPWGMPPHWYLPFHTTAKALNDLLGPMVQGLFTVGERDRVLEALAPFTAADPHGDNAALERVEE